MKNKYIIGYILLLLLYFNNSIAQNFTIDGMNYNVIDATNHYVEVASRSATSSWNCADEIEIPETVPYLGQTYTVTRIGDNAFDGCTQLTKVTIPSTIVSMGNFVFKDNPNLDSIISYMNDFPALTGYDIAEWESINNDNLIVAVPCPVVSEFKVNSSWSFSNTVGMETVIIDTVDICQGEPYEIGGNYYYIAHPGLWDTTITSDNQCNIRVKIWFNMFFSYHNIIHYYICNRSTVNFNDYGFNITPQNVQLYLNSPQDTLYQTINGCDSIYTIITHEQNGQVINWYGDVCQDSLYKRGIFEISPYYTSQSVGTELSRQKTDNTTSSNVLYQQGCIQNVYKVTVTVQPNEEDTIEVNLCKNHSYTWYKNGWKYPEGYSDSIRAEYSGTQNSNYRNSYNGYWSSHQTSSSRAFNGDTLSVGEHLYVDTTFRTKYGCRNDKYLKITVNPIKSDTIYDTICYSQLPYHQNGFDIYTYTSGVSNVYKTITKTNSGTSYLSCDSTTTLFLTIKPTKNIILRDTICFGESYNQNGFVVNGDTVSAFVTDRKTITKINYDYTYLNCDSTTTLYLVINNIKKRTINQSICYGGVYNSYNFNINTNNFNNAYQVITRMDTSLSYMNCDSITTLNLTINPTYNINIADTICYGSTYNQYGFNVSFNNYKRTSGYNSNWDTIHYKKTLNIQTTGGCDSIINLDLLINPKYDTTIYANICLNGSYHDANFNLTGSQLGVGTHTRATNNLHRTTGCDSTITLIITVSDLLTTNLTESICYGEVYNANGFNINTSTYSAQNTSFYIKDTLHLSTVAGCDSTVYLNLKVNPVFDTSITRTICDNETFNFNGRILSTTGNYDTTLHTINGCDSVVHLTLNVNPTKATVIDTAIVQNSHITFGNRTLNQSGTYIDSLQTYLGCDSVVTLNLIVWQNTTTNINASICQGETYTENNFDAAHNFNCNTTGTYTQNLFTSNGADSTVILNLIVNPLYDTNIDSDICWGKTYADNGFNIHTSDSVENPTEGMATIHSTLYLQSIHGCDSTVNLTLTVYPTKATVLDTTVCEGFVANNLYGLFDVNTVGIHDGRTLNFTQTVQTSGGGCDSIVTLSVRVNPMYDDTYSEEICHGETYSGHGFTIPTDTSTNVEHTITFVHSETTVNGCDSITTLHLTIHPTTDTTINAEICWGEIYQENHFYINSTEYESITTERELEFQKDSTSQYGCDSTIHLNLIIHPVRDSVINITLLQGQSYTINGFSVYTDTVTISKDTTFIRSIQTINGGCDSIVTLNVQIWANDIVEFTDTICNNEYYTEHNFNVNTTDTHIQHLSNIHGADSMVYLYLTVMPTYDTTINEQICYGDIYQENNFYIDTRNYANVINDSLVSFQKDSVSQYGCDSIIRLNLLIHPIYDTSISVEICDNETFNFNGSILNVAGDYDTILHTINGCDSVVHLNLIVYQTYDTIITDSICFGATYTLNNFNESEAGFYVQNLQSEFGCDSIVHLELKVMNFNDTTIMHLCDGESYYFHGRGLTETGFYRDTLQSFWGCDSIINIDLTIHPNYNDTIYDTICNNLVYDNYNFHIDTSQYGWDTTVYFTQTHNSIWGCDSVVTLALWTWPSYEIHITKEICEGGNYNDHGYEFYYVTHDTTKVISSFVTSHGCDSIFILDLFVRPTFDTAIFADICRGETFTMEGYNFSCTETGVYKDTLHSEYGCDSIKTVHLTVHENYNDTIMDYICTGGEYSFYDKVLTQPGIYIDTVLSYWGCDSILTLFLMPKPSYDTVIYDTNCSGMPYPFGDRNLTYTGQYIDTFTTALGCDSIVTLYLTVNTPYIDSLEESICNGQTYTLHGFNVSEAGRYEILETTEAGCDSIRILNLHVKPSYRDTIEASICKGDMYNDHGFIADRTDYYTHVNTTYLGCDSTITLHLTVYDKVFDTINVKLCEGESYTENNFNEDVSGIYQRLLQTTMGCDSLVTLNLTVHEVYDDTISAIIKYGETYTDNNFNEYETGLYTQYLLSEYGCDSISTLRLEVDRDAKLYIPNAFQPREKFDNKFCVYPNQEEVHVLSIKIFNRKGTLLWETKDINDCWDGKYKGQFVQQGVYIYKVEYYRESAPNKIIDEEGGVMVMY